MRIQEWPLSERPRERLQRQGANVLSDAELLAILLGHGIAGFSAVDIARQTLNATGGLRQLMMASFDEVSKLPGWGPARTCRLVAAVELNKRHLQAAVLSRESLCSPHDTRAFLRARLRDLQHEVFVVVFLDNQHRVIAVEDLFRGTLDSCSVHPREVVKQALKHQAGAVILAHNHPSGVAEPSPADRHITTRLKEALALVDIRTLDHLVIGDGEPVSFAERGWL
ncbi:MAG: DNA repair protein RadC [Paraperlucidibaca sp.]